MNGVQRPFGRDASATAKKSVASLVVYDVKSHDERGLAVRGNCFGRTIHGAALCLILGALGAAGVNAADAGSCYGIGDADARAYCLAKAHQEPSGCYSIQDSGMRSSCLAEVRK